MFDFAKRIWREVRRLFDYTTLKTALGRELTLSQSMVEALESWGGMMDGKAPWCVDPVVSLRIESGICREFADAVLVEMESSILNNDRLDAAYQKGLLDLRTCRTVLVSALVSCGRWGQTGQSSSQLISSCRSASMIPGNRSMLLF